MSDTQDDLWKRIWQSTRSAATLADITALRGLIEAERRSTPAAPQPYPNVPAFDHAEDCPIWGDRGPCNCKPAPESDLPVYRCDAYCTCGCHDTFGQPALFLRSTPAAPQPDGFRLPDDPKPTRCEDHEDGYHLTHEAAEECSAETYGEQGFDAAAPQPDPARPTGDMALRDIIGHLVKAYGLEHPNGCMTCERAAAIAAAPLALASPAPETVAPDVDRYDIPPTVIVCQHGHYWRNYGDSLSMCPVSDDNLACSPAATYILDRLAGVTLTASEPQPDAGLRDDLRGLLHEISGDLDARADSGDDISRDLGDRLRAALRSTPAAPDPVADVLLVREQDFRSTPAAPKEDDRG